MFELSSPCVIECIDKELSSPAKSLLRTLRKEVVSKRVRFAGRSARYFSSQFFATTELFASCHGVE